MSDEDSWESLVIWPCHILSGNLEIPGKTQFGHVFFIRLTIFQIPCKAYFGHVSLKSLLSAMYEFVTFSINFFCRSCGSVTSIGFQKHMMPNVALGICNQVEFIILCQANYIFEHTGNFLMISMTL